MRRPMAKHTHPVPKPSDAAGIAHAAALRKLRVKFIALNLATVFVILAVTFTILCVVDWQRSVNEVDTSLMQAVEAATVQARSNEPQEPRHIGGGAAPEGEGMPTTVAVYRVNGDEGAALVSLVSTASLEDDVLAEALAQIETDATDEGIGETSADATNTNNAGATSALPDGSTAADNASAGSVDADASDAPPADDIVPPGAERSAAWHGTLSDLGLHYAALTTDAGTFIAFADVSSTQGWQALAGTLALAGVGALCVFFLISLTVSRWALRPVEEAWRSQRAFVADASHELKTPLTVIMANLDIAQSEQRATIADQGRWLEGARAEADQMQRLIEDLLELAQLDETERLEDAKPVDLSSLAEGEILELEPLFFERDVELAQRIDPGITVHGNDARLKRLIGTLMDNAQKYAGDRGRVTVSLSHDGQRAVLSVANTGTPIPPEDLPHVFDRFYRSDKARTRDGQPGGRGLGLAIAHEIVCEHAGTIDVTSSAQAGTTFTVRLPLAAGVR